ncbi:hemagglutinin repeat-containing protein [Lysobacter changpingensis]|uniref:hemagglutinin repeat-containing protein n=1 Tax=Lysobacter changpingensis TaxID=2792784 RepID=UPI001A8E2187|nr:hemagglutinin repeat-containing protein [Lysobacter changpingensis]
MNKHLYRIVFNRALGVLQAVAEIVRRPGANGPAQAGTTTAVLRPVSFALWMALGYVTLAHDAFAQVVADPNAPGNQRPTVITAPSGAPLVNITTPSAAGVSRNTYRQFDVGAQGVVLNNSRAGAQTQLGGPVQGNPWLVGGTARVILNEVNSANPSHLNGYVEVAGDRAQVVIANPAGIRVNGGGFLNASRATLTTGTPIVNGGALEGYRVQGGAIRVDGAGLDATQTDYTDLIARSIEVNAGIWARQLQATLGVNTVSADQTAITRDAGATTAPSFALDVSHLGGMYANKIVLLGTQDGVGVRNAGEIGAQAGELVVNVDGRLENTGAIQAKSDARIDTTGGVANAGTLSAARELILRTGADLDNSGGTLNARRVAVDAQSLRNRDGSIEQTGLQALALKAGTITNRVGGRIGIAESGGEGGSSGGGSGTGSGGTGGTGGGSTGGSGGDAGSGGGLPDLTPLPDGALNIAGTLDNDGGRINAGGNVSVDIASALHNDGGHLGLRQLTIAQGELTNAGGELSVSGAANVHADRIVNDGGRFEVAGDFDLGAAQLSNRVGLISHSGHGDASLRVDGTFDNSGGTLASNGARLDIEGGVVVNEDGRIEHAGTGGLRLAADTLRGAGGAIVTAGTATLAVGEADHRDATLAATRIALDAADFDNRGGTLLASGNDASALRVSGVLDNGGGSIAGNGDLTLSAGTFGNAGGTVQHAGDGTLTVQAQTLNGAGGTIAGNGALRLSGEAIDLRDGATQAQAIALDAGTLVTAGGDLISTGSEALSLNVRDALDNTAGNIATNGALQLSAATLDNRGGTLSAAGTATSNVVVSGAFDNAGGTLATAGNAVLGVGDLLNRGGIVQSQQALTIDATGRLDNAAQGVLMANGDLTLAAQTLDNSGGAIEHAGSGALSIDADALEGEGGRIASNGALTITGERTQLRDATTFGRSVTIDTGDLITAGGTLSALDAGTMTLHADGMLDNTAGAILTNGALQLDAADLVNTDGTLSASGDGESRLDVSGSLDNTRGLIATDAALAIAADELVNRDTRVADPDAAPRGILAGTLGVQARHVDNTGGQIAANTTLALTSQRLDNANGLLSAVQSMAIDAATLEGAGGTIASNGTLQLTGETLNLRDGSTTANRIDIDAGSLVTAGGQLSAAGTDALALDVRDTLDNRGGVIATNGVIDLTAGALNNIDGTVRAAGTGSSIWSVAGTLDNTRGVLAAAGDATVHALDLINTGGTFQAAGSAPLKITADGQLVNDDGTIAANGAIELQAASLSNRAGLVQTQQGIDVEVAGAFDNTLGTVVAGGDLGVRAGSLLNRDTLDPANTDASAQRGLFGDRVILQAQQLDNTRGQIVAHDALSIGGGTLTNASGRIDGVGNVDVLVDALVNTDGELVQRGESGMLTLDVAQSLANTAGGLIGAEGSARVTGGSIDNSAGALFARNGLQVQSDADLRNVAGVVRSNTDLTIGAGGRLDNTDGVIDATGRATVNATRVDNVRGQILASASDAVALTVSASALDNRGGTVGTRDGDAVLNVATIDNSAGGTLASRRDLTVNATTLDNRNGTVFATREARFQNGAATLFNAAGQFGAGDTARLNLASIDNAGGGRIQAGSLWLSMPTLDTSGGEIAANALHLQLGSLTGTGRVYGAQWLDIDFTGDFTYGNGLRLESDRLLDLSVAGTLTNLGTLQTPGELAITAGHLVNQGTINASNADGTGINRITVGGVIDNRTGASLEGDTLSLIAGSVVNTGDIVGDVVGIQADTLVNGRDLGTQQAARDYGEGFIGAAVDLDLRIGQSLRNLDGEIFSAGDLSITGRGGDGTRVGQVDNISGRIQAEGDVYIAANAIRNERRVLQFVQGTLSPEQQAAMTLTNAGTDAITYGQTRQQLLADHCTGGCFVFQIDSYVERMTPTTGLFVNTDTVTAAAQIASGGDMTLEAGSILNRHSSIAAGWNLWINGASQSGASGEGAGGVSNISLSGEQVYQVTGEYEVQYQRCTSPTGQCYYEPNFDYGSYSYGTITQTVTPAEGRATITAGNALVIETGGDLTNAVVGAGAGLGGLNAGSITGPGSVGLTGANGRNASGASATGGANSRQVQATRATQLALQDQIGSADNPANAAPQTVGDANQPLPGLVPSDNGMFDVSADPNARFLVTTAPRFASKGEWTSSDYLLDALRTDPDVIDKRVGDGYYEQRLVLDQIMALTGRRSLNGLDDAFTQYRSLMDGAAAQAERLGLALGVPLTSTQIAALDQDIVWLVEQIVDGQKVLVPVVYLSKATAERLRADGALIAGGSVDVEAGGRIDNSGTFSADMGTWLSADTLINDGAIRGGDVLDIATRGDTINRGSMEGRTIVVDAGGDVVNAQVNGGLAWRGGTIAAGEGGLQVSAARDVVNQGTLSSDGNAIVAAGRDFVQKAADAAGAVRGPVAAIASGGSTSITAGNDVVIDRSSVNAGGHAVVDAGRDAKFIASEVGAGGSIAVTAGRDVVSEAVTDTVSGTYDTYSRQGKKRTWTTTTFSNETVTGSTFEAGGDIAMVADRDITLEAATVRSEEGGIALAAGRDLTLESAYETDHTVTDSISKKRNTLSKTTTRTHNEVTDTTAIGTTLSGERVDLSAGSDLTLRGAVVAGDQGVSLVAGDDIVIETVVNTHTESNTTDKKKSGAFGNGGIGFTIGSQKTGNTLDLKETTHTGSLIGSSEGRVDIVAGKDVAIRGSDVLSGAGTLITGANVTIEHVENTLEVNQGQYAKQGGLNVSLKGGVVDAAMTVYDSAKRADEVEDDRLKGLYAAKAGQALFSNAGGDGIDKAMDLQNFNPQMDADGNVTGAGGMSLRIGIGASSSKSDIATSETTVQGSTIRSNGEVAIVAREGDLTVSGSRIEGEDVALAAKRGIVLQSAQESTEQRERSEASSGEIGVTIGTEAGIGVYVSASAARGKGDGASTSHIETVIQGNQSVTFVSGNDTTLEGAQIIGERVVGQVGGDLTIRSQQDIDDYKRKDQSAGVDAAVGIGGGSVSVNYAQSKIDSNYTSVREQSGIQAGAGGFQIDVKGHTQLDAGAIASTADPSKNHFSTGSLGYTDLKNEAEYKATSVSVSVSGGSDGGSGSGGYANTGDKASSTTKAGIADGTLIVKDGSGTGIARGATELQQDGLKEVFDAQTVAEQMEMGQVAAQVGFTAVGDIARSMTRDYDRAKVQKEAAESILKDPKASPSDKAVAQQMLTDANGTMAANQAKYDLWKDGGTGKTIAHAVAGAMSAGLGGGISLDGALGAAAAELARPLTADENKLVQDLVSFTIGGAVGGTSGASTALAGEVYNRQLHPDEAKFLQDDKVVADYIEYMAANGVSLTESEARIRLDRYGAAGEDAHRAAVNGKDAMTEAFLDKESKGRTYTDSNGNQHAYFQSTATEYKDETINLNALYNNRFDPAVRTFLDNNKAADAGPSAKNQALYHQGQQQGYATADAQAGLGSDVVALGQGVLGYVGSVLNSGSSDQVGPYDELALKNNYQLLLKDEGRWDEAGFVEAVDWATAQRLTWVGIAAGSALSELAKVPGAIRSAGGGGDAAVGKPTTNGAGRVETPDHLLPDSVRGDGLAGRTAQEVINDLNAGRLPGKPIGGPGTPREMPATGNPNAVAEEFALGFFGGKMPQKARPIPNKPGAWVAEAPDGTIITYRPAGQASSRTKGTTATVDINSPNVNQLNAGKSRLELKFPLIGETGPGG